MERRSCSTAAIIHRRRPRLACDRRARASRRTNPSWSSSTTSTQDSGLFGHILPLFKAKTGIDVKVVAQGTGQALDTGRRGDADVVFVHAKAQEEKFLAEGAGVKRFPVMYNDFVLIGPKSDPAGIKGMKDVGEALEGHQGQEGATFISRGDRSGTHSAELAALEGGRHRHREGQGPWYKAIGQGMGAALNTAGASECIRAGRSRHLDLRSRTKATSTSCVEGDKQLFNQYGVMLVNPAKHPNVKKELGQAFIDWLVSPEGQKAIADYKINGEQLFYPNANDHNA